MQDLADLAKVYLLKAPGMTQVDVDKVLGKKNEVANAEGIAAERIQYMPADAEERKLEGPLDAKKLKWYIGKKSIGLLGCHACQNIPGYEAANPMEAAVNNSGQKEPERLGLCQAE